MAIPNPVTASALAMLTYVLTLALTTPNSTLRFANFFLMVCYVPLSFEPPSTPFSNPLYGLFGGAVFRMLLSYADRILIEKWSFETRAPTTSLDGQPLVRASSNGEKIKKETGLRATPQHSVAERLWWATANAFDCRFVRTPWEIVNVPAFSRQNPNWVPKKGEFLRKNAAVCALCLFLLDAMILLPSAPERNAILFAEQREAFFTRLGDVSAEEIVVRFISTGLYYLGTFLLLQSCYSGTAVVMVGLGVSEVKRWPPLFGWYLDAWSLRQFWGSFWHQDLRQPLSSPAHFITYSILGLTKGGLSGRYVFIFLTFWLSGVLHICSEMSAGVRWHESGVMQYLYMQAVGIALEDGVQAAYRAIVTEETNGGKGSLSAGNSKSPPSLWKCIIGYIWVASWMAWSVPVYVYPQSRRDLGEGILPISVVKRFL